MRSASPVLPDVVMTTTLSKALGSQGGVVLGPPAVRDHLIDAARPMIFDTGLAPAALGAALAALRVLIAEPDRPQKVLRNAAALADTCGVADRPAIRGGVGDPRCTRGGARRGRPHAWIVACGSDVSGRRRCRRARRGCG